MRKKGSHKRSVAHMFIPHTLNGRHPHVLRTTPVLALMAVTTVMQIGLFAYQFVLFQSGTNIAAVLPSAIALMTNEARVAQNAPPLAVSDVLTAAAQKKADDMVAKGYFAHKEPNGAMPWHWFKDEGYNYIYAGENLAVNFTDTQKLLNAWLASPTHRDNILKSQYSEIGIGMATGTYKGREAVFVVQFLGKQKNTNERSVVLKSDAQPAPVGTDVSDVAVLGEQTSVQSEQKSWLQKIKVSPRTFGTQMILVLLSFFCAVLALVLVPQFRAHPKAVLNGFVIVAALVFFLTLDGRVWGQVDVPSDTQSATVAQML